MRMVAPKMSSCTSLTQRKMMSWPVTELDSRLTFFLSFQVCATEMASWFCQQIRRHSCPSCLAQADSEVKLLASTPISNLRLFFSMFLHNYSSKSKLAWWSRENVRGRVESFWFVCCCPALAFHQRDGSSFTQDQCILGTWASQLRFCSWKKHQD